MMLWMRCNVPCSDDNYFCPGLCDEIIKRLRRLPCLALAYCGLRLPGEKEEAVVECGVVWYHPASSAQPPAHSRLQPSEHQHSTDHILLHWPLLILARRMAISVRNISLQLELHNSPVFVSLLSLFLLFPSGRSVVWGPGGCGRSVVNIWYFNVIEISPSLSLHLAPTRILYYSSNTTILRHSIGGYYIAGHRRI